MYASRDDFYLSSLTHTYAHAREGTASFYSLSIDASRSVVCIVERIHFLANSTTCRETRDFTSPIDQIAERISEAEIAPREIIRRTTPRGDSQFCFSAKKLKRDHRALGR